MRTCTSVVAAVAAAGFVAAGADGAQLVVDSFVGTTFDAGAGGATQVVNFSTSEPITGVALTGGWSAVAGDFVDGLFPWSLDLRADITAPGGATAQWGPSFFGDVTIADYPIADGTGAVLGGTGSGAYTFDWSNDPQGPGGVSRVSDPVYYATTTVPDQTFSYTASPDPTTSWDRPFFIDGVSGLGPTSYDAFEFVVTEPGVYTFESVLSVVDDHFSFLYRGGFDDGQPLENLLDYGLGNGNSPFGVPRGTSAFSALLFPGETYTWVTSQWSRFDPIVDAENTIVGPGAVIPAPVTMVVALPAVAVVSRRRRR